MAPLPKRRHSSQRQAKRSRALKTAQVALVTCSNCHAMKPPHSVCPKCGFYNGKQAITIKTKHKHTHKQ